MVFLYLLLLIKLNFLDHRIANLKKHGSSKLFQPAFEIEKILEQQKIDRSSTDFSLTRESSSRNQKNLAHQLFFD